MYDVLCPNTLFDALSIKDGNAEFFAGGTYLMSSHFPHDGKTRIIDIRQNLPKDIREEGDFIIIGGGATFSSIIGSSSVPSFLKEACAFMSSSILRNMATIGGNIALFRDDSYLLPTLIASGAILSVESLSGRKEMSIREYSEKKEGIITEIKIRKDSYAKARIIRRASHMHSVINIAYGDEGFAAAVKGTGIIFPGEKLEAKSDMYGKKEYKEYLYVTLEDELKEAHDGR